MDTLKALTTRRSIRRFKSDTIDPSLLNKILSCAMHAPSAHDYRPWYFIVIDDKQIHRSIMAAHPYARMLDKAPSAIAVCGDLRLESNMEYAALDCAAATQNILLAIHALQLGGVWIGIYPRKERMAKLQQIFSLPDHIVPVSLVAIGNPDETPPSAERFDENRIRYNRWS